MKRKFSILAAAIMACGFLATGCATTGGTGGGTSTNAATFNVTNAAAVIEIAAESATGIVIRKQPESRQYFAAASVALNLLLADGTFDPQQVRERLAQVIPGEASDETWIAITSALSLYQLYGAAIVSQRLDQIQNLRPILLAFARGIDRGLRDVPK